MTTPPFATGTEPIREGGRNNTPSISTGGSGGPRESVPPPRF